MNARSYTYSPSKDSSPLTWQGRKLAGNLPIDGEDARTVRRSNDDTGETSKLADHGRKFPGHVRQIREQRSYDGKPR